MVKLSRVCRFRLFSVSGLLLVVSFCLAVYCLHLGRLVTLGSARKEARVYKVSNWELPDIPEVVLTSFKPQPPAHDVKQNDRVPDTDGNGPVDSLTPDCPAGHVRKGKGACVECSAGKFSLPGWIACRSLLSCDDFKQNVRIRQGSPVDTEPLPSDKPDGWSYYIADWEGYKTILVCPNISSKRNRIHHDMIHDFRTAQRPLHVIGLCSEDSCILYFASHTYKWAPLLSVVGDPHLSATVPRTWHSWYARLIVLHNIVNAFAQLHSMRKYTLCSGMSVEGILQQFLVNTENGQVSFVGLGSVVSVAESPRPSYAGSCSKWQQQSTQVLYAPEELVEANGGRYSRHRTSIDRHLYLVSQSTADLWKVPNIADFILGSVPGGALVRDYLAVLHMRCKSVKPVRRPSFAQLLSSYRETLHMLSSNSKIQHLTVNH